MDLNPLGIALNGIYPSSSTLEMASSGWLYEVTVEPVPEIIPKGTSFGGGSRKRKKYEPQEQSKPEVKKEVKIPKKVTVKCIKDGEVIEKTKIFKNIDVTVENVKVEIVETSKKPRIVIKITK